MKCALHADDFVIDDPDEEIIYKYRPKFSLVKDLIWYSLGPLSKCDSLIDSHGIVITQEKNLASRHNKGP